MRTIPTRVAVLLVTIVASLAAMALAQPSWPSGVWAVLEQLITAIVAGTVVFGALLAVVVLIIEVFWPGEKVSSWQGVAWLAAGLLFGVLLVTLAPYLPSVIPATVSSSVLTGAANFVANISQLLGVGLVVYYSYRVARDFIRRTVK